MNLVVFELDLNFFSPRHDDLIAEKLNTPKKYTTILCSAKHQAIPYKTFRTI